MIIWRIPIDIFAHKLDQWTMEITTEMFSVILKLKMPSCTQ